MSKRYPPIYSIVAIIALVTVATTNTKGAALYVASTIVKTLAILTSNIANYLGFVLTDGFAIVVSFADKYAVCEKCYDMERTRKNKWRNKQ